MTHAVVSLGTNTVRLLVVRYGGGGTLEEVEHAQKGTRLGTGLRDRGTLAPDAVSRTLEAVAEFVARAQRHGAGLASIATSALRRADDGAAFCERMRVLTGVPLEILSGEQEAAYSFRGATAGEPPDGTRRFAVVDVGGGSTESAVGYAGRLERVRSVEIGSVRLAERFPALLGCDPGSGARIAAVHARAAVRDVLGDYAAWRPVDEVRAVAGTPATVAAIAQASHVESVAGSRLTCETLDAVLETLLALDLEARRALPGMLPQRADVLPAGAIVLSEALRALNADTARVEPKDLLLGFLLSTTQNTRGVSRGRLEAADLGGSDLVCG